MKLYPKQELLKNPGFLRGTILECILNQLSLFPTIRGKIGEAFPMRMQDEPAFVTKGKMTSAILIDNGLVYGYQVRFALSLLMSLFKFRLEHWVILE